MLWQWCHILFPRPLYIMRIMFPPHRRHDNFGRPSPETQGPWAQSSRWEKHDDHDCDIEEMVPPGWIIQKKQGKLFCRYWWFLQGGNYQRNVQWQSALLDFYSSLWIPLGLNCSHMPRWWLWTILLTYCTFGKLKNRVISCQFFLLS